MCPPPRVKVQAIVIANRMLVKATVTANVELIILNRALA